MEREAPAEASDAEPTVTESAAEEMILLALALLRFGGHLRTVAERYIDEIEVEVLKLVALADLTSTRRHRLADELGEKSLALVQAGYRLARKDLEAQLAELAVLVGEFVASQIDTATAPGTAHPLQDGGAEDIAKNALIEGALLAVWLSRLSGDLVFKLERIFGIAAGARVGATEVLRDVREAFDSARRNTHPILRTAITAITAITVERMVAIENPDVLKGYVHCSVLDSRTTKHICLPRAGLRWLADGTPVGHDRSFKRPPLHMGCRSHLALWFKPLEEMPGYVTRKIRKAGREDEFVDRPVIEPVLEKWLRSRPVAEQRAIVGSAKWEAWRGGKLTVAGLLDQSGRPLTLGQIRKLLGL
jgi:hypothetical protein